MFQELLKEWYYTGFFVGTLSFAIFYLVLWSSLIGILQRLGFFRLWYGLEEPMCDLDMDLSLGGFGGDDNMRDRHVHGVEEHDDADNNRLNNNDNNESSEGFGLLLFGLSPSSPLAAGEAASWTVPSSCCSWRGAINSAWSIA